MSHVSIFIPSFLFITTPHFDCPIVFHTFCFPVFYWVLLNVRIVFLFFFSPTIYFYSIQKLLSHLLAKVSLSDMERKKSVSLSRHYQMPYASAPSKERNRLRQGGGEMMRGGGRAKTKKFAVAISWIFAEEQYKAGTDHKNLHSSSRREGNK